jgi:hypothetical protein
MSTPSSGKSFILLYGLLYGVASIAFTVILYIGGVPFFMSPIAYLGIALPFAFAFLVAAQLKKKQGGYLEFSESLKATFKVMVLGLLISMIFDYILFKYIDVPFNQALMQATAQEMERKLANTNMSQEKIDEYVDKMANTDNYSLPFQGLTFAIRCILHFIVALIVSAIMKRNKPMFENTFNQ